MGRVVNSLGDLEHQVMEQLWAADEPQSVRDVHAVLVQNRELAYTTVMTVLDRLTKKNLVSRESAGRAYRYAPSRSREQLVADVMHDALPGTVSDRTAALVAFVEGVTPDEADAMRTALAKLERSQPS